MIDDIDTKELEKKIQAISTEREAKETPEETKIRKEKQEIAYNKLMEQEKVYTPLFSKIMDRLSKCDIIKEKDNSKFYIYENGIIEINQKYIGHVGHTYNLKFHNYTHRFTSKELNENLDIRNIKHYNDFYLINGIDNINRHANFYDLNNLDKIINKLGHTHSELDLDFYHFDKLFDKEYNIRIIKREIEIYNFLNEVLNLEKELPSREYKYYDDEEEYKPISNDKIINILNDTKDNNSISVFGYEIEYKGLANGYNVFSLYSEYSNEYGENFLILEKDNKVKSFCIGKIMLEDDYDNKSYFIKFINLIKNEEYITNNISSNEIISLDVLDKNINEIDLDKIWNDTNPYNSNLLLNTLYWKHKEDIKNSELSFDR